MAREVIKTEQHSASLLAKSSDPLTQYVFEKLCGHPRFPVWFVLDENLLVFKSTGSIRFADCQKRKLLGATHICPCQKSNPMLALLPPVHRSSPKLMVLFGSNRQKSPISFRLKTSSVENCLSRGWRTCCCHSKRSCKSTAPASLCTVLNVISLRFLKLSSQPSLAMKSGMCISSASFNAFSLIKSPPTGRFCSLACFSSHMSTPSSSSECLAGFSFWRFDGIPALIAASIASFLLRIPISCSSPLPV